MGGVCTRPVETDETRVGPSCRIVAIRTHLSWARTWFRTCLLALALGGCQFAGGAASRHEPGASPSLGRAEFVIESQIPGPVQLFAAYGALRVRLGTLSAWHPTRFSVPPELVGKGTGVQLVARAIGDPQEVRTEPFAVQSGDRVLWTVLQPIESSVATLRIEFAGLL